MLYTITPIQPTIFSSKPKLHKINLTYFKATFFPEKFGLEHKLCFVSMIQCKKLNGQS